MTDNGQIACEFSKMMIEGRIRAALKILSDNSDTGLLSLNDIADDASGMSEKISIQTQGLLTQTSC